MPRINLYTSESARTIDPSLTRQASAAAEGAARANAQGLAALGDGLTRLGEGMINYGIAKQRIDDNLFANEAKNAATQTALEANNAALMNPEQAPDGTDLFNNFENDYDMAFENYAAELDDNKKAKAKIIWDDEKNNMREKLFVQQRDMHGKFISNKSDEIKQQIALSAFQNPDTMMQGQVRMNAMYDDMQTNGLINPAQNMALKKMASEEIAIQSIQGDIRARRFDQAKERVIVGDASSYIPAEKRTALLDIIDREKMQAVDSDLKMQKIEQDRLDQQKKNQSEIIFRKTLGEISVSTNPTQKEAAYQKILNLRTAGLISDEQFKFTSSVIQDTKGNYNEPLEFQYRDKILRANGQFDALQNDIVNAVNTNAMDAKTGSELLSNLNTRKIHVESDPAKKARYNLAEGRLDAAFGKDTFFEPMDQPRKIAKQNATELMFKRIEEGMDPLDAASEGIRLYGKSVNALPLIPGVDFRIQSDPNGLDAAKQQLMVRYRSGQMSKDDYAKAIKTWMDRSNAVKMQIELDQAGQPKIEGEK